MVGCGAGAGSKQDVGPALNWQSWRSMVGCGAGSRGGGTRLAGRAGSIGAVRSWAEGWGGGAELGWAGWEQCRLSVDPT